MKSDLYLKVVLTVIAAALVMLVLQNMGVGIVTRAIATPGPMPAMSQSNGLVDVNIVSVNGSRLSGYGGIDVNVKNTPEVKIQSGYGGIDVKVTNYRDFK